MSQNQILIVDDDARFRSAIRRALKGEGYSFVEAGTIKEGLEVCRNHQAPKVVLLDLGLPDGTGKDFLELLGPDTRKFKVIVLTAHEENLAADLARGFQVFRYLPKAPQLSEALRFTVSQAFKETELEQLLDKNKILNKIQEKIHSDIPESTSIEETQNSMLEVLRLINNSVRELLGAYTSHIRVYDLQKGDYHLAAFAGPNDAFREIFKTRKQKPEPFSGMIAVEKAPRNFADLRADQNFQAWKTDSLRRLVTKAGELSAREYFSTVQSAFVVPVTTHLFADEVDAVFNVSADSKNFFSQDRQEIVLDFVSQATVAITKAWQKVRKQETHRDYQRINCVLEDISRELGAEDAKLSIYNIVTRGIAEIIKPESITLYLHNKTTGLLKNEAEFPGGQRPSLSGEGHPIDKGLTALVYTTGKAVRIPNLQIGDGRTPLEHENASTRLFDEYADKLPSGRVDHYLGVPMIIGEQVIGAVQLLNKKSDYYGNDEIGRERWLLDRGFSDDAENVLGIAASHLAMAIRNAELLDQNLKQISQLAILMEVGRFRSSETLSGLLETIIRQAAEVVQAEICLLFLKDENNSEIVLRQRHGMSEEDLAEATYEIGEGYTGGVAATLMPYLSEDKTLPGKYDREILRHLQRTYGKGRRIESLMIVPIQVKGELVGVIKVINKQKGEHFDLNDLSFLEMFASYVGIAIENVQRYELSTRKLAAAERNATLSNLVRAVAHEINNTWGLIPINVQLIRDRIAKSNFDIGEMIDVIEDSAQQVVGFANNIHAFGASRLGELKSHDINAIIRKALSQLLPTLNQNERYKRVSLELNLTIEPLECAVYETPFIQVVQNIVMNAYQAMYKKREARLVIASTRDLQRRLARITFVDNGCGVKKEHATEIFRPDFSTRAGGSGIGLWLAKTHLSTIDASITVQSVVREGAKFTVEIPLSKDPV